MEAASHTGFIIAAYACALGVVGGLTGWILADYRAQLRKLATLERRGIVRRSATPAGAIEPAKERA